MCGVPLSMDFEFIIVNTAIESVEFHFYIIW